MKQDHRSSKIELLAELPGLEAAKQAIDARIAEIRRLVYGEFIAGQPQREIRRRTITEETRKQRREFLAKARAAKLQRLAERKAAQERTPAVQHTAVPALHPGEHGVAPGSDAPVRAPFRKRK